MDDPDSPVQIWLEFEAIDLQHDDRINFGDIVAQDKWISCANDLFKISYKKNSNMVPYTTSIMYTGTVTTVMTH